MPVRPLPENPNLDHLKRQAKDLMRDHAAREPQAAQRVREFHPSFHEASDERIFAAELKLSDAQLTIARERGFASWPRLKRRVEKPKPADNLNLPMHERIEDVDFRHAVDLLDAGDVDGLRAHLNAYPGLAKQHVAFEGGNYFQNPGLIEFIAENPIRHGKLPPNIVEAARAILDAGAKEDTDAVNSALSLVCSGRIPRECGIQIPLIELLCTYGANPGGAMATALTHGELSAASALIAHGAPMTLTVAAAFGWSDAFPELIVAASAQERHRALALAAQFGQDEIVRQLLDAGEDPNRYNPPGFHAHSTPLHQAALAGHEHVVQLLVERGARLDIKDAIWQGTPAGWAEHAGKTELAEYLRGERNLDPAIPHLELSPELSEYVRVGTCDDPGFDDHIRALLPKAVAEASLTLKPYLFILSNPSQRTVVAHSIRLVFHHANGRTHTVFQFGKYPPAILLERKYWRRFNDVLSPGDGTVITNSAVFSPGFESECEWVPDFRKHLMREHPVESVRRLEIRMDTVILDDGKVLGRDESALGQHFSGFVATQRDVLRRILDAMDAAGESLDSVLDRMGAEAHRLATNPQAFRDDSTYFTVDSIGEARGLRRRIGNDAEFLRVAREALRRGL